jgi:2-polyprenyl-6-methoxyphenol hydroxylase-like FAD-dependent oxidoreductase
MDAGYRILIVGAGIAGLAVGRALLRNGFRPEIIERAESWPTGGTGLYIPGNGVAALTELDLADEVLTRAVRVTHQRILDHRGRQLAEIELSKFWKPAGPCVGIARDQLYHILLKGAEGATIRLDTTVRALSQDANEVHVVFADGSSSAYDFVVGADGIHSSVRQMVFGALRPRYLGQVSWRFVVDDSGAADGWTAMLGRKRAFLRVPIGPTRLYCYADLVTRAGEEPTHRDLDRFRALFADFAEPVPSILGDLTEVDRIHFAPIEEIATDTWVHGRIVLVGDAAHASSPNMAEGASMALEDANVLTNTLKTTGSPAEALLAFRERRRNRLRWLRQRTHRRDRIRALPGPLRNLSIRLFGPALYRRDYRPFLEEP